MTESTASENPRHEQRVAARRPPARFAITVRGKVHEEALGTVLPHEHILFDLRAYHEPLFPELSHRALSLELLGKLRRHPTTCLDNLVLDNVQLAIEELSAFARAGGGTVVDLACLGPRTDLRALARIAQETGLNIIAGTGIYAPAFYPDWLAGETVDGLAARFSSSIEQGIGDTGIQAGILGKLELPDPSEQAQAKVLRAAARASAHTGSPIAIDCPAGRPFEEANQILSQEQVPPAKVILCGMDSVTSPDERQRRAELGYYLLFDGLGKEWYVRGGEERLPRDPERLRVIKQLIDAGFVRQLMLSQGIDRKMLLRQFGGWGYAHICENLLPMMVREKFAPKQITTMMLYNPARVLAFAS
jgi:phosphotriesterase-related protein